MVLVGNKSVKKVFGIILFIVLTNMSFSAVGPNWIEQWGIRWTFDKNISLDGSGGTYRYGQFVNGDYWVLGPVTITSISPLSQTMGGRTINGSMLNPAVGMEQGYDGSGSGWNPSLNISPGFTGSNLVVNTGTSPIQSLISSISVQTVPSGDGLPRLETAAVLTIMSTPPSPDAFRPPYNGNSKPAEIRASQLDLSARPLANLTPTPSVPSLSAAEGYIERVWLHHKWDWTGGSIRPSVNMNYYGRDMARNINSAALLLNSDSGQDKTRLLYLLIQNAIDVYGIVLENQWTFYNDGGGTCGKLLQLVMAAHLLDHSGMKDVLAHSGQYIYEVRDDNNNLLWPGGFYINPHVNRGYYHFGDSDQIHYVTQVDVDVTNNNYPGITWKPDTRAPVSPYTSADIGTPEWGIRHSTNPGSNNKDWEAMYRATAGCHIPGSVLVARIMGITNLFNNPAYIDYADRYMTSIAAQPSNSYWRIGTNSPGTYATDMWNTYRANYGPLWPDKAPSDTTAPLAPVGLTSSNQTSDSIQLAWTAPGAATDGDFASNYRILRNGSQIAVTAGTSYADSGLTADTAYNYSVYSVDDSGNQSAAAATLSASTQANTPQPATGVYYISPDGSNSNSGTDWNNAMRTLPASLSRGVTYYVAGGLYSNYVLGNTPSGAEMITVKKATAQDHGTQVGWKSAYGSTTAVFAAMTCTNANYVSFDGQEANGIRIEWDSTGAIGGSVLSISDCQNISVQYCELDGKFEKPGTSQSQGSCNIIYIGSSSDITIDHCKLHDGADDGIEIHNANNLSVRNTEIYNLYGCGTDGGCGPCFNGHSDGVELFNVENAEFISNFFHNISSTSTFMMGNHTADSANNCRNLLFANNIFYNNGQTGFTMYINETHEIRLYNNVIWGQVGGAYGGLAIGNDVTDMEMYNNIILSVNYSHMGTAYDAAEHRGDYNVFGMDNGQYQEQAHDRFISDPGFVMINAANGPLIADVVKEDFMLETDSPCVNSGTTTPHAYDITGTPRPQGSGFDIGAFELEQTGQPDTVPPLQPSKLVSPGQTESTIQLSWTAPAAAGDGDLASAYQVHRNGVLVTTVNSVSYTDAGLEGATAYSYKIYSLDDAGNLSTNAASGTFSTTADPGSNNSLIWSSYSEKLFESATDYEEIPTAKWNVDQGAVAMWVHASDFTNAKHFVLGHAVQPWSNRIQLYCNSAGSLQLGLGDSSARHPDIFQFSTNEWYHVGMTWNGSGYSVYVNGNATAQGTYSGLITLESHADIGNNAYVPNRAEGWLGIIDDIEVYSQSLSGPEVIQIYNKGRTDGTTPTVYTLNTTVANGMIAISPSKANYNAGETVTLRATANTGYTFTGWSGDASGIVNPVTITMDSNKSVTANFSQITYTLDVAAANGSVTKSPNKVNYNAGEVVTLTATANDDYTFAGWGGDAAGITNPVTVMMDGNKSVTASFEPTPAGDVPVVTMDSETGFDKVNDYKEVSLGNASADAGTINLWMNGYDFTDSQYLFGHTVGAWSNRIQLYIRDSILGLGLGDTHQKHTNIEALNPSLWYMVTLTWDGVNYAVYVNDEMKAAGAYSGLTQLNTFADIGNTGNTDYRSNEVFHGRIDDVKVYDVALDGQRVAELYAKGRNAGSVVAIGLNDDFDGDDHSVVREDSGMNLTAVAVNAPVCGDAWCGDYYRRFNGSNQAVQIDCVFINPEAGTIGMLVQTETNTDIQYLFGHTLENTNYIFLYTVAGKLALGLGDKSLVASDIAVLESGVMYHIALTWNGTSYEVYVDGQRRAAGTFSGLTALAATADIANMGTPDYRLQNLGLAGVVDDVRVYNRTLSASEILALSNTQEVKEHRKLSFEVYDENDKGERILYAASEETLPPGATFDADSQMLIWNPWYDQAGDHKILFVPQDQSEPLEVTVSVQDVVIKDWYREFLVRAGKL